MVKVTALDAPEPSQMNRIGFLSGYATVPDVKVFNALGNEEILSLFDGDA